MSNGWRRILVGYAVAAAAIACAALLTRSLWSVLDNNFSLLFLVAVVVSAVCGGVGPAVFSALAAALVMAFMFLGPVHSFRLDQDDLLRLLAFVTVATMVGWLSGARRRSEEALRCAHQELEERVKHRTATLRDVNDELLAEITERRKAEQRILAYQERLRSLALQLSASEELERRRLATALHDALGHRLAVVAMKLEALLQSSHAREHERALGQAQMLVDEIIRCTRSLTTELSPPILFEVGLRPALEWLGERFRDEHDLDVTVRGTDLAADFDEDARALLFSASRELLMNVVKHSGAKRAAITLADDGAAVTVSVSDDGRGCDPSKLNSFSDGSGFGLFNIRERVTSLGGRVHADVPDGQGCRITMTIPSASHAGDGAAVAERAGKA